MIKISSVSARLLLYPQNPVFCCFGDSEFNDGLGCDLDFLPRRRIKARACLSLLLHQLSKTGQYKFIVLFNLFVREVAERIEEHSSGSLGGLGGGSECDLKFTF